MTTRKPALIWSTFPAYKHGITGEKPEATTDDFYATYAARTELLANKGIELKFLVPPRDWWSQIGFEVGPLLEREFANALVTVSHAEDEGHDGSIRYLRALEWPRDTIQTLRGKAYVSEREMAHARSMLESIGIENAPLINSPLGEGGIHVGVGRFRIIGNHPSLSDAYKTLEQARYTVHKMPLHFDILQRRSRDAKRLIARTQDNGHIDTELNVAESYKEQVALVASQHYADLFAQDVSTLTHRLSARMHVADEEETANHAINFITLPDGSVIIPDDCPKTIKFLQRELGERKVSPVKCLPHERTVQGGLRCRTVLI